MNFTNQNLAISDILPKIESYQSSFVSSSPNGLYFEAPRSDSADGQLAFSGIGINVSSVPVVVELFQYLTWDNNRGWEVRFTASDGLGNTYQKTIGYGVETQSRTQDWTMVYSM